MKKVGFVFIFLFMSVELVALNPIKACITVLGNLNPFRSKQALTVEDVDPMFLPAEEPKYVVLRDSASRAMLQGNIKVKSIDKVDYVFKTPRKRSGADAKEIERNKTILINERAALLKLAKDPEAAKFFPKVLKSEGFDPQNPVLAKEFVSGVQVSTNSRYDNSGGYFSSLVHKEVPQEARLLAWRKFGGDVFELVSVLKKNDILFGDMKGQNLIISNNGNLKLFDIGGVSRLKNPDRSVMDTHGGTIGNISYPDHPGEWMMALDAIELSNYAFGDSLGIDMGRFDGVGEANIPLEYKALYLAFKKEVRDPFVQEVKNLKNNLPSNATVEHAKELYDNFLSKYMPQQEQE